jgi:hypothetical protein
MNFIQQKVTKERIPMKIHLYALHTCTHVYKIYTYMYMVTYIYVHT